jgi:hypothetical protein
MVEAAAQQVHHAGRRRVRELRVASHRRLGDGCAVDEENAIQHRPTLGGKGRGENRADTAAGSKEGIHLGADVAAEGGVDLLEVARARRVARRGLHPARGLGAVQRPALGVEGSHACRTRRLRPHGDGNGRAAGEQGARVASAREIIGENREHAAEII